MLPLLAVLSCNMVVICNIQIYLFAHRYRARPINCLQTIVIAQHRWTNRGRCQQRAVMAVRGWYLYAARGSCAGTEGPLVIPGPRHLSHIPPPPTHTPLATCLVVWRGGGALLCCITQKPCNTKLHINLKQGRGSLKEMLALHIVYTGTLYGHGGHTELSTGTVGGYKLVDTTTLVL